MSVKVTLPTTFEIDQTHLAGVERQVNLACSGASTAQVGTGTARGPT